MNILEYSLAEVYKVESQKSYQSIEHQRTDKQMGRQSEEELLKQIGGYMCVPQSSIQKPTWQKERTDFPQAVL